VTQTAAGLAVTPWAIGWLVVKTVGFLALAIAAGVRFSPVLFRIMSRLHTSGALLATGLSFCFVLAWASDAIGLAPIIGAFTRAHPRGVALGALRRARRGVALRSGRADLLVARPIFFVLMGMRADFSALFHPRSLLLSRCSPWRRGR